MLSNTLEAKLYHLRTCGPDDPLGDLLGLGVWSWRVVCAPRTAGAESPAIITNASAGIYISAVRHWPNCFTSLSLALLICKAETKMSVVPSWLED